MVNELIHKLIANYGQIPIDWVWQIAIQHYYSNTVNIGREGDFITAPEFSPEFSNTIAKKSGRETIGKTSFNLIELGPGYGTLTKSILDYLKENKLPLPDSVLLLESSSKLKKLQKEKLAAYIDRVFIVKNMLELSSLCEPGASFNVFISNEFFDTLPIKQFSFQDQ